MITKVTSVKSLKQMFIEIFLNKTDKVTDISVESTLNGIAYGVGKVGQKCLTNQAVVEAHLFPDSANGDYLDEAAKRKGISARFAATGSTTYLKVMADSGTYYDKTVNKFLSTTGIVFSLQENYTMPKTGYAFLKVKSDSTGLQTNVDPITINKTIVAPNGHISCTNEYKAIGGSDFENDDLYRIRIKESVNQLARNTISYIEQILMKINNNVLRVLKGGIDGNGVLNLFVLSCDGSDFTVDELNEMVSKSEEYLSLSELLNSSNASTFSLKLNNINWFLFDVQYRVDIDPSVDFDTFRKNSQIQISKLFDYRYWKENDKIEWENILFAAKNINGARYVPDASFYPRADINVPSNKLPRIRSFVLRDLDGNIIYDNGGVMSLFFYPNEPDYSFQDSVLATL